jgi:hypothetical protein
MKIMSQTEPGQINTLEPDSLLGGPAVYFEGTVVYGAEFALTFDPASAFILSTIFGKVALEVDPSMKAEIESIIEQIDAREGKG